MLLWFWKAQQTAPLPDLRKCSMFILLPLYNQQGEVSYPSLRACDKCAYHYSDPEREKFKQETLTTLTTLCVHYLGNKLLAEQELKNLQ